MRKLRLGDCFKLGRILKHNNMLEALRELFLKQRAGEVIGDEDFFITILDCVVDEKVEKEFYDLLTDVAGENVSLKSLSEIAGLLKQIAAENDMTAFFKLAADMTKKQRRR